MVEIVVVVFAVVAAECHVVETDNPAEVVVAVVDDKLVVQKTEEIVEETDEKQMSVGYFEPADEVQRVDVDDGE